MAVCHNGLLTRFLIGKTRDRCFDFVVAELLGLFVGPVCRPSSVAKTIVGPVRWPGSLARFVGWVRWPGSLARFVGTVRWHGSQLSGLVRLPPFCCCYWLKFVLIL